MFWLWGPSSIPWGLRGEIIKVLSEMRKWSLPLEWLVTPPTQGPVNTPPRVWYIQGGSRLPWRAKKGAGPCSVSSNGVRGPSPKHSLL